MSERQAFPDVVSSSITLPPEDGVERKIHVRTAGTRKPSAPAVVIICGLGSGCLSFTVIQQSLADAGIYTFSWDRVGVGRSSSLPTFDVPGSEGKKAPRPRNATQMAAEMEEVLQIAKVNPPYILVSHSYGGVTAWEYVAAYTKNVVGLVFLDANSVRSAERPVMDPDLEFLSESIEDKFEYEEIVGLNAANRLPSELWDECKGKRDPPEGWTKGEHGVSAEVQAYFESCPALRRHQLTEKHPLGKYPVTVIKGFTERDIRRMIAAAEKLGGGTKEQRDELSQKMNGGDKLEEDQQRDHLLLTETGRKKFVDARNSGHWIHVTEPEIVVEEIKNMVEHLNSSGLLTQFEQS